MTDSQEESLLREQNREHERSTNRVVGMISLGLALINVIVQAILRIKLTDSIHVLNANRYLFLPLSGLMTLFYIIAARRRFDAPWIKYMLVGGIVLLASGQFFLNTVYAAYFVLLPLVISARYFNKKFIARVGGTTLFLFALACVLNLTMGKTWDFMALAHQSNVFDTWERPLHALTYLILPFGMTLGFVGIYCIGMTRSGRKILRAEAIAAGGIAAVETELATASQIQQSVLPPTAFTTPDGHFTLEACEHPAREVGGDFYDWFMINSHTLAVLVADVSDKGVPAALFMMSSKKAIRCALECCKDLKEAITLATKLLAENNESTMFLTMWLCLIDTETGIGKYINAGHPYPLIRSANGETRFITNEPDLFLGAFENTVPRVRRFALKDGDTLLLYTDGITDALNEQGRAFNDEGAKKAVETAGASAKEVVEHTLEEVHSFAGSRPQFDDITLLALRCNSTKPLAERVFDCTTSAETTTAILDGINALLDSVGCPEHRRREADVAIDELCTNITDYAYDGAPGPICVKAEAGSNYLRITFTDEGVAFDPLAKPDPVLGGEPSIGGLGIYLVKKLSDDVSYRRVDGRNELTVEMLWGF